MEESRTEARSFLKESHDLALWMIQLADTKADILVVASAILAGLLVPEAVRTSNAVAQGILILAVGLALLSTGMSLATVFPRTTPKEHSSLLYFVAIMEFKSGEKYLAHVQGFKSGELDRELAQQAWELAHTQAKKYRYLRAGVVTFVVCLAATLAGVLLTLVPGL